MSPGWGLPWTLLLLWLPGSFPLSGPDIVKGTVGGSLSVRCLYEEEFKPYNKYWCRERFIEIAPCNKIVETEDSEREARSGRVTIRDHPVNLSFTVTLENLILEDAGSYWCGVNAPWKQDSIVEVVVAILPASRSETPASVTVARTSTTTTEVPAMASTCDGGTTHSSSSQKNHQEAQDSRLAILLSLLAVFLLLLVLLSLLVWRILQKRVKGGEHSGPGQKPRQAGDQCEPYYANLQLHTWSLQEEPAMPRQVEVEYSMVAIAGEDLHYTSVVFDSQKQDSNAKRPQKEEPVYSVVKKPGNHHLSPCPS